LQSRQKHSILSLLNLISLEDEYVKGFWNQAMVRKVTAPGFIFVFAVQFQRFRWACCAPCALKKASKLNEIVYLTRQSGFALSRLPRK
jgi:hypothetical protein